MAITEASIWFLCFAKIHKHARREKRGRLRTHFRAEVFGVTGLWPITQKDSRWSTTGSPRDGIGCSFKLRYFFQKRITSKIKSVLEVFFFTLPIRDKGLLGYFFEKQVFPKNPKKITFSPDERICLLQLSKVPPGLLRVS